MVQLYKEGEKIFIVTDSTHAEDFLIEMFDVAAFATKYFEFEKDKTAVLERLKELARDIARRMQGLSTKFDVIQYTVMQCGSYSIKHAQEDLIIDTSTGYKKTT